MLRLRTVSIGAALALCGGPCIASAVAHVPLGFSEGAIMERDAPTQLGTLMRATGATVVRYDVQWQKVEAQRGVRDWSAPDRAYAYARRAGLSPLIVLRAAPRWAASDPLLACGLSRPGDSCQLPPAPAHLADWWSFVTAAAARYPAAAGFEIYNEPNYGPENWRPSANAGAYVQVLGVARDAIKRVLPTVPVVSGGLLNLDDDPAHGNIAADIFLRDMYAAGARGLMDAIAIHPYSTPRDSVPADSPFHRMLDQLRVVRSAAGDDATPFWITEVGYPTGTGPRSVSEAQQADRIVGQVGAAMSEPDIQLVLLHGLVDHPGLGADESAFGLVHSDLSHKPAYDALVAAYGSDPGTPPPPPSDPAPAAAQSPSPLVQLLQLLPTSLRTCDSGASWITIALARPARLRSLTVDVPGRRTLRLRRPLRHRVRVAVPPGPFTLRIGAVTRTGRVHSFRRTITGC